ncbi:MAG: HEPN domain-containing protein, partial [Gammaproteobacteria bacterium]
ELQREAQEYYDHWFDRASSFYNGYMDAIKRNDNKKSAFELNQTTESCYKTILLVFTSYCPHEHHLPLLESMASSHIKNIKQIFPRETPEQHEQFDLLDYAYIGARYDLNYSISKEDLEYLSQCVEKLIKTTEKSCLDKIQSFVIS